MICLPKDARNACKCLQGGNQRPQASTRFVLKPEGVSNVFLTKPVGDQWKLGGWEAQEGLKPPTPDKSSTATSARKVAADVRKRPQGGNQRLQARYRCPQASARLIHKTNWNFIKVDYIYIHNGRLYIHDGHCCIGQLLIHNLKSFSWFYQQDSRIIGFRGWLTHASFSIPSYWTNKKKHRYTQTAHRLPSLAILVQLIKITITIFFSNFSKRLIKWIWADFDMLKNMNNRKFSFDGMLHHGVTRFVVHNFKSCRLSILLFLLLSLELNRACNDLRAFKCS